MMAFASWFASRPNLTLRGPLVAADAKIRRLSVVAGACYLLIYQMCARYDDAENDLASVVQPTVGCHAWALRAQRHGKADFYTAPVLTDARAVDGRHHSVYVFESVTVSSGAATGLDQ